MAKHVYSLVPDSPHTKAHVKNDLFTMEIEPKLIFLVVLEDMGLEL